MTSRRPYWCPKTMKRRSCGCPKPILWELNSFLMQTLSFVPINLHGRWPREWKHFICLARHYFYIYQLSICDENIINLSASWVWPFLFPSVGFCEICCSSYFCHICCSIFSHRKKNSCYFCGFLRNLRPSWSPSWPFLFLSVEFCEICYSCYFCHICCSIFSHSRKNSCYFCDFFKICGLLEALLDLFSF